MPENQGQEKRRRRIPSPFTAVRLVRVGMAAARTVGAVASFLANPASLAVLVPVGLVLLAIFVIFFGSGFTGAPAVPGAPGVTPILQPTFPPGVASDCPVPGGEVTTPSYEVGQKSGKKNGHCDINSYEFVCSESCPTTGRRAKSIDIKTGGPNGKNVILPTVQGKSVSWIFMQPLCAGTGTYPKCYDFGGGTGALYTFKGTSSELTDAWYIQFVHMDTEQTYLNPNDHTTTYPSGTPVGKTDKTGHVHSTIGKNIDDPYGPCDSGWQSTDPICQ